MIQTQELTDTQPIKFSYRWGKATQDTIEIKAKDVDDLKKKFNLFTTDVLSLINASQEEK